MKSDISRQTFNSRKHYSKVVMQQGRVQLDADWNEQQDILLHRLETQTSDTIGRSGVPANDNGFGVMFTPDGQDLVISPGSMYVDGILCELEQEQGASVFSIEQGQVALDLAEVDNEPFKKQHWAELVDRYGRRRRLFKITDIKINEDQQTLKGIADGAIDGTVVQQPYEFGYQSMIKLAKYIEGDKSVVPGRGESGTEHLGQARRARHNGQHQQAEKQL